MVMRPRVLLLFTSLAMGCAASDAILPNPPIEPAPKPAPPRFRCGAAFNQSSRFLLVQHGFRLLTEDGTRAELKGPFIREYGRALKGLRGWGDGDPFIVNYVGHPFEGATYGFIQIQNDPRGMRQQFSSSREYWQSRLRAMGWAGLMSTQFELGPLSEASIGNIGKVPGTSGVVDLVVSPVLGTGVLVMEDVLDRYVVQGVERRISNPAVVVLTRSFLNPNRAFANVLRGRFPWHRDTRPGIRERGGGVAMMTRQAAQ